VARPPVVRPFFRWNAGHAATALLLALAAGPNPRPAVAAAEGAVRVEHTPPACLLAGRVARLVACLSPRSSRAGLRIFFHAEGSALAYSSPLRSDVPCYSALLPRPSPTTARVSYWFEAQGLGARSQDYEIEVVADASSCAGRLAALADGRATWDVPAGAPRTPPGFEGTDVSPGSASLAASPTTARPAPPAPRPATPPPSASPTAATPASANPAPGGGGHGLRTVAIVGAGVAAAGGAAVVVAGNQESGGAPAATTGTGLPLTGVSGVYVGTETVNYPGGCVGTDDVVLNLQEAGGQLSGVLTFTVRTCVCCSSGRGANSVSGSLSGTSLSLATPIGFSYSGSFAGNRLAGGLAGPEGISGSWTVDKR
jgi:hypothetical protein